ncbi:MAG: dihydroorotate dehydrogenase electron transfer subunit [Thermodesulfobacteriota bacterium]|nr:dihydroorotate dehydrogenase electron transfer subunit [Thermodesulfobacteriota bacterium]
MYQISSKILYNKELSPGYYKIGLDCPDIASKAAPGQFIMIRVSNQLDPFLRRPFSIHMIHNSNAPHDEVDRNSRIDILYKVVGKGTEILSTAKEGGEIDIVGPMGNGFQIHEDMTTAIFIAGGVGVAPLLGLAEEILLKKKMTRSLVLFLGGKTRTDILCVKDFERLGAQIHISTEDGSLGRQGIVTDQFVDYLESQDNAPGSFSHCFACGPEAMLKEVAKITQKKEMPCQVSLETMMACGLGACLGCVVRSKSQTGSKEPGNDIISHKDESMIHHKKVCKDGPVFNSTEIIWE